MFLMAAWIPLSLKMLQSAPKIKYYAHEQLLQSCA